MFKKLNRPMLMASAAFVAGLHSQEAHAGGGGGGAANSFDNVWGSITGAVGGLPSLISVAAYIFGILFAVLGVLKIKEHVENPQQTPLKDGAIKLCAGGALFALPFLTEIMSNLVDGGGANNYEVQQQGAVMAYTGTAG
jgi:type IV secretory pathway VirB2 component (pilin)